MTASLVDILIFNNSAINVPVSVQTFNFSIIFGTAMFSQPLLAKDVAKDPKRRSKAPHLAKDAGNI